MDRSIRLPDNLSIKKSNVNEKKRKKEEEEKPITDKQWDDYVTELLLKEAKIKRESYEKEGIGAYLREHRYSPNVRTNKRFLRTMLEHAHGHNQILRNTMTRSERTRHSPRTGLSSPPCHRKSRTRSPSRGEADMSAKESTVESMTKKIRRHHPHHEDIEPSSSSSSCHRKSDESAEIRLSRSIQVKGRGAIGVRKMDRYFKETYDPKLDFNPHEEYYLIPEKSTRISDNPVKNSTTTTLQSTIRHDKRSTITPDVMYGPPPPPSSSSSIS